MKLFGKIVLCIVGFVAFCYYFGEVCWPEEAFVRPTTIWRPNQNTTWTKTVWPNYGEVPASPPSSLFVEFPGPVWINPPLVLAGAPIIIDTSGTVIANRTIDARGADNGILVRGNVDNIVIRGCRVSGARFAGIRVLSTCKSVTIDGCTVTSNGSTGISSQAKFLKVVDCDVYDNGKGLYALPSHDAAGIAASSGTILPWIERNHVYSNGKPEWKADPEISVIRAVGPVVIRGNDVDNAVHGGIGIYDVPRGGLVEYNVVSGWGATLTTSTARSGFYSGISLDVTTTTARTAGVVVHGNIIVRGRKHPKTAGAGISCYSAQVADVWLTENVFAGNVGVLDVEVGSLVKRSTWREE